MGLLCKIAYVYIPLYPAFEDTRCVLWYVGVVVTAHRRGEGARITFLQGGAKFEVTPLVQAACMYLQQCPSYGPSKLPLGVMQFFGFLV